MEWYEILVAIFALSCVMGALVIACLFDYKYKVQKLEFEEKKENDFKKAINELFVILTEINNNICDIKNRKE